MRIHDHVILIVSSSMIVICIVTEVTCTRLVSQTLLPYSLNISREKNLADFKVF